LDPQSVFINPNMRIGTDPVNDSVLEGTRFVFGNEKMFWKVIYQILFSI